MSDVTIYYNPDCGNCREALLILRGAGVEPRVVEYMTQPLSKDALAKLVDDIGVPPRALLRDKDPLYQTLELGDPKWSDSELLDFMARHPALINRPIVTTPKGTRLCRPPSTVLQLLA